MFSHLIVALIAALLLSVAGHPVHSHSPSQTTTPTPTTTGDCSEPTSSPIISLTPTPTSAPPTSAPPTTAPPTPTSPTPTPTPTPTTTSAPSTPTGVSTVVSNAVNTGGVYVRLSNPDLALIVPRSATYFYQNGNPGACGQVHSDSDFICAMGMSSQSLPRSPAHSLPQIRLFSAPRAPPPLSAACKSRSPTWTMVNQSPSLSLTTAPPARTQTRSTSPSVHSRPFLPSASAYSPVSPFISLSTLFANIPKVSWSYV